MPQPQPPATTTPSSTRIAPDEVYTTGERTLRDSYQCATCQDTGEWTGKKPDGQGGWRVVYSVPCPAGCASAAVFRVERERRLIERAIGESGLPERYRRATLSDFRGLPVVRAALDALDERRGLLIFGPVGSGKTHLAAAMTQEAIKRGQSALFVNVPHLLSRIRSTFRNPETATSEQEILAACSAVDWLVLDDLGAQNDTPWVRDELFLIVNDRYEASRPVVATSNESLSALAAPDRIGERSVDRLSHVCKQIVLGGATRRAPGGAR